MAAVAKAHAEQAPVIGHLQLLNAPEMSPAWIEEMRREIRFGQDLVAKMLKKHMLQRMHPDWDARRRGSAAARIARDLSQANRRFSHGRMIGAEECRNDLGLDVEILDRDAELWQLMWEIWVRMEIYLQTYPVQDNDDPGPAKLFVDADEVQASR